MNIAGGRRPIQWDDDMIACLRQMRAAGKPINVCAKRIGVANSVARKKAHELGIGGRMRSGPAPGTSLKRARVVGRAEWERRNDERP